MKLETLWAGCLLAAAACAGADTLVAPQTLSFDGKAWNQVWHKKAGKEEIYEYTTNGESSADWKWTRLITLRRLNTGKMSVLDWNTSVKVQLTRSGVVDYRLTQDKDNTVAQALIVYSPTAEHPVYEPNAWVTRYVASCDGLVSWQVARQLPAAPADASDADKRAVHVAAASAAQADLKTLEAQNGSLACE